MDGLQGDIETPLRDIMAIIREDNKWGKNVPAFGANSLTFTGNFQQGEIGFKYINGLYFELFLSESPFSSS